MEIRNSPTIPEKSAISKLSWICRKGLQKCNSHQNNEKYQSSGLLKFADENKAPLNHELRWGHCLSLYHYQQKQKQQQPRPQPQPPWPRKTTWISLPGSCISSNKKDHPSGDILTWVRITRFTVQKKTRLETKSHGWRRRGPDFWRKTVGI